MERPPTVTLRKTHSHWYKALYWNYILGPQKALVLEEREIAAQAMDGEVIQCPKQGQGKACDRH
jgi:hypothetical protein